MVSPTGLQVVVKRIISLKSFLKMEASRARQRAEPRHDYNDSFAKTALASEHRAFFVTLTNATWYYLSCPANIKMIFMNYRLSILTKDFRLVH